MDKITEIAFQINIKSLAMETLVPWRPYKQRRKKTLLKQND